MGFEKLRWGLVAGEWRPPGGVREACGLGEMKPSLVRSVPCCCSLVVIKCRASVSLSEERLLPATAVSLLGEFWGVGWLCFGACKWVSLENITRTERLVQAKELNGRMHHCSCKSLDAWPLSGSLFIPIHCQPSRALGCAFTSDSSSRNAWHLLSSSSFKKFF